MRDILGESLKNLKQIRIQKSRFSATLLVLSLVVSLNVFWTLRQPGLTLAGDASCGITDHTHSEECFALVCICESAKETHIHGETCFTTQLSEKQEQLQLICTLTDSSHAHDDSCYTLETTEASAEQILTCSLSETAHVHEEVCYIRELRCQQQEHIHNIECYSDETADAETLLDWQNMFAAYPYTGNLRDDLVGIAKTQVGYCESTRNFEVGSDGIRRGYTRYGAWYGTPYRDWSAAFVSFCLNYAGADLAQTPGNIGANTMAELWRNLDRFAPVGEYIPSAGDLVFFTDNTVAIVSEVHGTTFYLIRGDMDDAVGTASLLLNDAAIAGWGMTTVSAEEPAPDPAEDQQPDPTEHTTESTGTELPLFMLMNSNAPLQIQTYTDGDTQTDTTPTNLKDYLGQPEVGGTISFKLFQGDTQITPDENENYTVDPYTGYKLSLYITSPNGILPGTYQYQLPAGLIVSATSNTGTFTLTNPATKETLEVGTWEVDTNGLITMVFNETMESQSNIQIFAKMDIQFSAQNDAIDFDGQITVTVNPPPDLEEPTVLQKWGVQGYVGAEQGKTDRSKIYWTIKIEGHADSQIPGSVLTDRLVSGEWIADHRYTESDIAAGLRFDATGPDGSWHTWMVYQSDNNLEWTETGWSYTIPETTTCQDCQAQLTLGNDGWEYLVNYSTTPDPTENTGSLTYANQATVDKQTFDGYIKFQHGEIRGEIQKTGSFRADASGGSFHWEITAVIPGIQTGQKADFWYITDNMSLYDSTGNPIYITNDADQATVTATHNGTTVHVPHISEATDTNEFTWYVSWSANNNGIDYGRTIYFLHRCDCTAATCPWWRTETNDCGSHPWINGKQDEHFCQCWTTKGDTTFTLTYKTDDLSIIENYGGVGSQLGNYAELYHIVDGKDNEPLFIGSQWVGVTVPGLFKKELTKEYGGYIAHYKITVNEAKLSLTDGGPLHIHDEMTETLAFISGSLVITAENADGTSAVLQQGTDYTYTYDGTGATHILEIEILHSQPLKYTIDYDATLILPDNGSENVTYGNSATVTLWGKDFTDGIQKTEHIEFGITGESYTVQLRKTCETTGTPLVGATFGLYNAQGGQIATGETDVNGLLPFRTSITQGIIFREHELYYLQELQAPPGYQLDDTPHWFIFCNSAADTCTTCTAAMGDCTATRIPHDQISHTVDVTNAILSYNLPATGGPGVYPLILVSVMLIITPLVYTSVQRRKRERRADQ